MIRLMKRQLHSTGYRSAVRGCNLFQVKRRLQQSEKNRNYFQADTK
jgi:hypothetical protein